MSEKKTDRAMTAEEVVEAFGVRHAAATTQTGSSERAEQPEQPEPPRSPTERTPDWWAVATRLLTAAPRYVRGDHALHRLGTIMRWRDDVPYADFGPCVVVEVRESAAPDFGSGAYGQTIYGKRADVRLLCEARTATSRMIVPLWAEWGDVEVWPVPYESEPVAAAPQKQKTED